MSIGSLQMEMFLICQRQIFMQYFVKGKFRLLHIVSIDGQCNLIFRQFENDEDYPIFLPLTPKNYVLV